MRTALFILLTAGLLWLGEVAYRLFLRPIDLPTPAMQALEIHLNTSGVKGHLYAVRHSYRHSQVTAAAGFKIDGFPLPIALADCPDEYMAEAFYQAVTQSPNLTRAQRNGSLVFNLPMWADDAETDAMALRAVAAFQAFKSAP
ncbi:MAG: hypothetical protein IIA03_06960 [Proteobacteria bacterium]|jgi:hypothetical protein|nr:hypothetical protein [Methylibium sp.]MBY0365188.1 hypothetical protein [Burkholderiaceae bacterium]MCH8855967.1 hypothetical protein [Pseudomonadota bacterium]|mmetsp:Transcript_9918/g.23254  ORF Transcript_9918/g.23254 Transcript_9918/m.23254 type:complete len:143 (-) Transcript_9918:380-808(-)